MIRSSRSTEHKVSLRGHVNHSEKMEVEDEGNAIKPEYPTAEAVPDKDGSLFSPYKKGEIVGVRGIPSGTLVQDSNFPSLEKKFFRVP